MPLYLNPKEPLPRFRVDLKLYAGPSDHDGSPTYNFFDPVKESYYKISWEQQVILQCLRSGMTLNDLCKELSFRSTAKISRQEVITFFEDAYRYNLLEVHTPSEQLVKDVQRSNLGIFKLIFYRYLYFRVPILHPNEFLKKTLPYVLPLASKTALTIYFILTIWGLALLINRFSDYVNTFNYFFNLNGLIGYILGISFFKLIHEFAHAYTASYYKVNIPSMGFAFIFLIPVLYTDATDGWKLSKRHERMRISAAGLVSELILAGLCTLGWALSPPGVMQTIFFVISSVIWLSSLFFNLNPAMRFDGYYLLSDALGVDNLQSRSFTLAHWWIRHKIFGMNLPYPEEGLSKKLYVFMIVYAFFTWIYRIFFYIGMALLVYHVNTKAKIIGVAFFALMFGFFIVLPVVREAMEVIKLRQYFYSWLKPLLLLVAVIGLVAYLAVPSPTYYKFTAITEPIHEQDVYSTEDGQIQQILVKRGVDVKKGDRLINLFSEKITLGMEKNKIQELIVEKEIAKAAVNPKKLSFSREKINELEGVKGEIQKLNHHNEKLKIDAEIDGKVITWDEYLYVGQYVNNGLHLGSIAGEEIKIITFVPEKELRHLNIGQKAEFKSRRSENKYSGTVSLITPVRSKYLDYASLSSLNRGDLPVIEEKDQHHVTQESLRSRLAESYYIIEVSLDDPKSNLNFNEEGIVEIKGPSSSYLGSLMKKLLPVFWRESGV